MIRTRECPSGETCYADECTEAMRCMHRDEAQVERPLNEEPPGPHEHKFVFLRQDSIDQGGFRPDFFIYDVYFCEACLLYRKVLVAKRVPEGGGSGYVTRKV